MSSLKSAIEAKEMYNRKVISVPIVSRDVNIVKIEYKLEKGSIYKGSWPIDSLNDYEKGYVDGYMISHGVLIKH